jgi:hypothetical protein
VGAVWLNGRTSGYPNVVEVLRAAGLRVDTVEGWETRSRSSGGFEALLGIVCHHTASNTTTANDVHYCVYGSPDAPVANCLLDREGLVTVWAAGASNHAGKGGGSAEGGGPPWYASGGQVPPDSANSRCWGIEAANSGDGVEAWPQAQTDAYVAMVAALVDAYGLVVASDVRSHAEWTPPRKIDPRGPSPWQPATASSPWAMDGFRADVASSSGPTPPPSDGDLVLTLFMSEDFSAKFLGFSDSRGLGFSVSWIADGGVYEWYKDALKIKQQTILLTDCQNLILLGPLPVGDGRHAWQASDFRLVVA